PKPMPAKSRSIRPKAGQRTPGINTAGRPTVASPSNTGKAYQGPATRPIRKVLTVSMMTSKSTRLAWLDCPSRSDRRSRLPRVEDLAYGKSRVDPEPGDDDPTDQI